MEGTVIEEEVHECGVNREVKLLEILKVWEKTRVFPSFFQNKRKFGEKLKYMQ